MARSARITSTGQHALLRAAAESFSRLLELLFSRYPDNEWATFARFGWRQTPDGLVLTLADLMPPMQGELDESVGHVKIREPYTLRAALEAERHPLAIGVIHSHPLDCPPDASPIDDDMDGYGWHHDGQWRRVQQPGLGLVADSERCSNIGWLESNAGDQQRRHDHENER